jgi:[2-(trimethylamino)ethyl]phosphonate dioxygenase
MTAVPTSVRLSDDRRRLLVAWADGAASEASAMWLFDNAAEATDAGNGQRLHGALEIEAAGSLADAALDDDAVRLRFAGGAERRIGWSGLRTDDDAAASADWAIEPWLTPGPVAAETPIDFSAYLHDDDALRETLRRVASRGLAFLSGAPTEPGAVERAVARFGFVRETNYGRTFQVRTEPRPANLAYTPRGLDLHADNPYRDPPPSLQLLHAITVAPRGGENQFADGFAHAAALAREAPDAFAMLRDQPVGFRFTGPGGDRYETRVPIIETGPDGAARIIRLNHRSLRTADLDPAGLDAWYAAYLDFYRRVHDSEHRYERRLEAGDMVIFDNWRMLHGRSAYADDTAPRWLEGCYADRDGLLATLARLSTGAG